MINGNRRKKKKKRRMKDRKGGVEWGSERKKNLNSGERP